MGWLKHWLVVGLVLLAGCTAEPEPVGLQPEPQPAEEVHSPLPSDGSLKSDRATYTATCQGEGYEKMCTFTLVMTYTNQTDATVYFDHCYPEDTYPIYFISGLTEESAYSGAWACVGHDRFVKVEPGGQRVDTLELRGPNAWDGVTGRPFGVLEGRLQVLYEAYTCPSELGCKLPREAATSNVFTVALPD